MNDLAIYGLIALGALAIAGLGVKIAINYKGGTKNNLKNVTIHGPYAGRDNRGMDSKQDTER
ncbi:hypothetical protein LPB260_23505 [Pseudomonas sp. LPB0260]|uniref:hypothetical protein n=1 Tax=Pseudomonas sp. LPB0260 TaxID=2614442 RepID=UPI0015C24658|nr:hypothetical protein [Pseudomonas sp. LPB0260]QLC73693.1 hypothetical protein LPB260_08555 [Pseudomonas sp. LPB0260]QLC76467.1 hypothetical protein LPB260_23505 [Pseudomonas sp. LPB0260]